MANGASEPESAAEGGDKGPDRADDSVTRRESMRRAARAGLVGLSIVSFGGMLARETKGDENCNNFTPPGGVSHDSDCGHGTSDITCSGTRGSDGSRWTDANCRSNPMNGDADCGGQAGLAPSSGPYHWKDNSCGYILGRADLDCGLVSEPTGANHHTDATRTDPAVSPPPPDPEPPPDPPPPPPPDMPPWWPWPWWRWPWPGGGGGGGGGAGDGLW